MVASSFQQSGGPDPDKARIHSLDEIASAYYDEDINRDDDRVEELELGRDVFSSSWAVLDLVCQWLSGEVTPLELPLEANAIDLVPTILVHGTRPCSSRDSLWLHWKEHAGLGNVEIRDRWNELSEAERRELAPKCCGKIGKDPRAEVIRAGTQTSQT